MAKATNLEATVAEVAKADPSQFSFEENISKLQQIVAAMESNKLNLKDFTDSYREGLEIIEALRKQLNEAKQLVENVQTPKS